MKRSYRKNRGIVLILAFMIIVAITVIAVAFLFMVSTRMKGSGYDLSDQKALWVAEGGFQDVMYRLKNDSDYRDNPAQVNGSVGDGTYTVTVTVDNNIYTMTSTGTVGSLSRQVTQSVEVTVGFPDAFDYAVFGDTNSNTLRLRNNVAVSGDLYYDGDVDVQVNASVVDGLVYADTVSGAGTYTEAPGDPDPVPTYPTFDTTFYDDEITTAEGAATSNWTLSGSSSVNLNDQAVYYKKVTIKDDATITGPGTIVATKDVVIRDNANISPSVTIITKTNLTVRDSAAVENDAVLYGRNSVQLQNNVNVEGSLLVPTNNKIVTVQNSATFTGIIYADKVRLRDSAVVSGSVVADSYVGDRILNNASVTFNESSLPDSAPEGLEEGDVTVTTQGDWDEI